MTDADSPFLYFLSEVMVLDAEMFSPFGLIFGTFAISIAPALSSKTLQCILGVAFSTGIPCCLASPINHMIGSTSLMACESAMYSASVVDKAISVLFQSVS